jgi:TRAP-type C4-dicarboxylate transport system permease small subunit
MKFYIGTVTTLSRIAGVIAVLLLTAAVLVVAQMVIIRYALGASTIWQTEFVIYAIVAATFLGSPQVLIERGHVGVDLLPNALGPRGRRWLEAFGGGLSLAFCGVLAWSGWHYFHEAWAGGWKTETVWALPLWIPLLPLPLGIGLLSLQYIAEIAQIAAGRSLSGGHMPEVAQ